MEESSSFLKKRTKKLLPIGVRDPIRNGARTRMSKSFLVLFFKKELLLLSPLLLAAAPPVSVTGAWARASLPHQTGTAAYLTLASPSGDTLTGVDSADAGMVMLHQTTTKGGMSDMSDMDSVTLPPGKTVSFAPGGMHLMVMDVKHALKPGDTLHLVLHFSHAGDVPENVPVLPATATGPSR